MPSSPQVERPCKTIAMAEPVSIRNCRRSMWGFSQFSVARPGISKRNEQVRSFPEYDSRLSEAYGVAFIRAPCCRHMDAAGEGISGASFGPARRGGFPLRAAEVVEVFRVMPLGFYPGWLLCDIQTRPAAAESAGEQGFTACSTVRTASPCSTALRRRSIATTTSTNSTSQPRKTSFPISPSFASSRAARHPRILAPRKARRPPPAAGGSGAAARPGRGQSRGQDDCRGVAATDQ